MKKIYKIINLVIVMILMIQLCIPISTYATWDPYDSKWAKNYGVHTEIMGYLTMPTNNPESGATNFDVGKAAEAASSVWDSKAEEDENFNNWAQAFVNLAKLIMPNSHPAVDTSGRRIFTLRQSLQDTSYTNDQNKFFIQQAKQAMIDFATNVSNCTDPDSYPGGDKVKDRLRVYKKIMEDNYGDIGTTQTVARSARTTMAAYAVVYFGETDVHGLMTTLADKKKFSLDKIKNYYNNYGYNYYFEKNKDDYIDINSEESAFKSYKKILERIWYVELETGKIYSNFEADSYAKKLTYDQDQIRQFLANTFYDEDSINTYAKKSEKNSTMIIEWAHIIQNGEHTEFYRNNEVEISNAAKSDYNKFENTNTTGLYNAILTIQRQWNDDNNNAAPYLQEYSETLSAKRASSMTGMTEEEVNKKADEALEDKKYDEDKNTAFDLPANGGIAKEGEETSDFINDAESFVNKDGEEEVKEFIQTEKLKDFSQTLYGILFGIGVIVAVIVGLIIGVKLMLSSVEERAEAKKLLVPYIVGCVIVFGAFGIWQLVVTIMQQV